MRKARRSSGVGWFGRSVSAKGFQAAAYARMEGREVVTSEASRADLTNLTNKGRNVTITMKVEGTCARL